VVRGEFPNRPALPLFSCPRIENSPLSAFKAVDELREESAPPPSFAVDRRQSVAIPDGSAHGVDSAIDIPGPGPVLFATVRVAIDHSWRGDLSLSLTTPAGQRIPLAEFAPTDSADDLDVLLFLPELSGSTSSLGRWTLNVVDAAAGEQGVLEAWSLGLNAIAPSLELPGARLEPVE
jgi:hypothetical protein